MADVSGAWLWSRPQKCNKGQSKPNKMNFKSRQDSGNPVTAAREPKSRRNQCSYSKRPSYLRLDSTGENSAGSSEELNGGFSPEIHAPSASHYRPRFQEQAQGTLTSTEQGSGLLNKVRAVFGNNCTNQYWPRNPRNTARNLAQRTPTTNNADARLANLDSVAEKFTSMNMASNMNYRSDRQPGPWGNRAEWQPHGSEFRGAPHNATPGQWGGAANHQATMFRPYPGMNQPSPFLSSTQNYHRNFYPPPWQQMMARNPQHCPPFHGGFKNFAQPWQQQHQQHQQHPLFPWQQFVGPQMMMQGRNQHQGSMARPRQQRGYSPGKKQRWNSHGSQKRQCHQQKVKEECHTMRKHCQSQQDEEATKVTESVQPVAVIEMKCEDELSKERTGAETKIDVGNEHAVNSDSAIYSAEESIKVSEDEHNVVIQDENVESQTSSQPKVSKVFERHSSIDLILSNYDEVESGTGVEEKALSASSDSEDSDAESDSDSAVETNADLWESFTTTDDPYNPLCGWRCNNGKEEVSPGVASNPAYHVDSGTDEGDNWSETDSDDDYDSGEDLPNEDEVDSSLPRSFHLSDPQLKNLRESLSSTPKEKSNNASHHPSVAFILGSTSSSSEDDDDDWDTVDDSSVLQDDPLWNSFNRSRDPYSPMEAWKCHASNLSSSPTSSPPQTPMRKRDSVEGLRTLLLHVSSTEPEKPSPHSASIPRKDSEGESFAIATVRIYAAKDDMDVGSFTPSGAIMKRVVSASCLRRVQLTPQDKAAKRVRFCPNSSFIVLVEKDSPSSETGPNPAAGNDWQACARDRMRFKARIDQLSHVIDPVLTKAHRERVYASRMDTEGCR